MTTHPPARRAVAAPAAAASPPLVFPALRALPMPSQCDDAVTTAEDMCDPVSITDFPARCPRDEAHILRNGPSRCGLNAGAPQKTFEHVRIAMI